MNKKIKGGVKSSKKYTKQKKFNYSKIKESVNKSIKKAKLKASQLKFMYIFKKIGPLLSILKDKMLVNESDTIIHKKSVKINSATIQKTIKNYSGFFFGLPIKKNINYMCQIDDQIMYDQIICGRNAKK